jgi:hypothetical protein
MNLGQYIAQQLLEANQETIAIFPGAFKPPHKGHLEVAKMLLKKANQLIILVSPNVRDGIDADESVAVWNLYKTILDGPVEVRVTAESPIKETYNIVKNNPDDNFIVAFGKAEADRFNNMVKYPNVTVFDGGYVQDANATQLRQALDSKDETAMQKYLPNGISPVDFLKAIGRRSTISPQEPTQLQEVQPMDTTSPYHDLVVSELGKIDSTAQKFNVPINDLQYAFEAGKENILTDDIWSKLENSDSYQIKNLEQAIKLANKYKKDWRSIVRAIQDEKQLPLPLVLNYAKDKYYLVGGNARLMFYKALGVQPIVLLGTIDLTIDEDSKVFDLNTIKLTESQTATVGEFIKYAIKNLAIQNPPRNLTFSYDNDQAKSKRSFGYFDPNDNKIWVYVKNRNMADILRTLAHELVHRKQAELGMLDNMSGETGSIIENEANAQAGVLLRDFGKINDSIYEGLKKKLNELDFDLNKAYDWKFEGGVNNKYTFTTGQTEYEVFFQPGVAGDYERSFRIKGTEGKKIPYSVTTNEFKVMQIYATVMNITIDFLKRNKDWKNVMIVPVDDRRHKIVKGFLDKTLPSEYFADEDELGVIHIYKKFK